MREKFFDFFRERGHTIVPSSSLIPDDPSVLLTTAGMQQFKPYYTGQADPMVSSHPTLSGKSLGSYNTASIQKCFRTSDIDEVGDERHLTFFEMMGNFSFGGYFKREAIAYAYDFLKNVLGLEIDYVTVFDPAKVPEGDWRKHGVPFDEESYGLWKEIGMPESKIRREGIDNFWGPTGKEGPCGPTTEIYIEGIEVWNIVFNQFYCDKDAKLTPLKIQGVDTGMGLERLAMVSQGVPTIFDADLFTVPFGRLLSTPGGADIRSRSNRILFDHLRGSIFLLADGVRPSNKEAGYVLRRVIRRLLVHSKKLFIPQKSVIEAINNVIKFYEDFYSELKDNQQVILREFEREANKFALTLEKGLKEFDKRYPGAKTQRVIPGRPLQSFIVGQRVGKDAFDLYQSCGFPVEVIKELLEERLYQFDENEFRAKVAEEFERHREISRAGQERKFGGHGLLLDTGELKAVDEEELKIVTRLHTATHLTQAALRKVLGERLHQAGSDITAERMRFDFTFDRKLTPEELQQVVDWVNEVIRRDVPMEYKEMPYEEAIHTGALYFEKEKYPPMVKVYRAYDPQTGEVFSKELCGGPHVTHTGELGKFKILKEEAVGAGVRRLRAVVQ